MNLAKALKLKNRYAQRISQLQTDIQQNNSLPSENKRKIDVNELMGNLDKAVHNLVRLKIIIFVASASMRESILLLSEAKSRISFLKGIDTNEGKGKRDEYRNVYYEDIKFEAIFDITWVRAEIEKCEETVDKLQEELDTFNYRTEVDVS